jgi:TatD DNase family protein
METERDDPDAQSLPERPSSAFDTHCHLFLMDGDVESHVAAARDAGVTRMVCAGIDPQTSARSLELAESFEGVFATAGMHPHTASAFDRAAGSAVEQLLASPMVVAVGETGLDYFRLLSPAADQQRAFRTHIALSRETGKPLVVHVRDAWDDALRILDEEGAERVVLHCFTGDEATAAEAAFRGYLLSFAGNLTYPNAGGMRRAAATVPEDRIVLETDSPFLPPQTMRGQPNAPGNVLAVAEAIASVRGVSRDRVVERSAAVAAAAFGLAG